MCVHNGGIPCQEEAIKRVFGHLIKVPTTIHHSPPITSSVCPSGHQMLLTTGQFLAFVSHLICFTFHSPFSYSQQQQYWRGVLPFAKLLLVCSLHLILLCILLPHIKREREKTKTFSRTFSTFAQEPAWSHQNIQPRGSHHYYYQYQRLYAEAKLNE